MLNDMEHMSKFDAKSDEGIFLGYSLKGRAYRILNKRTQTIMESMNVVVDDQESDSLKIRRDDVKVEFTYNKENGSVTLDKATPSSSS